MRQEKDLLPTGNGENDNKNRGNVEPKAARSAHISLIFIGTGEEFHIIFLTPNLSESSGHKPKFGSREIKDVGKNSSPYRPLSRQYISLLMGLICHHYFL